MQWLLDLINKRVILTIPESCSYSVCLQLQLQESRLLLSMVKTFFLVLLIMLYVFAGINHFWHPAFYLRLIPRYLPNHALVNMIAGGAELVFGIMLIFPRLRKWAAYGIIAMLVAFIPSHVYSISLAGCSTNEWCTPLAISWVRLFVIHPFLIAWAWWFRK